jgi:hypothetical protein
VRWFYESGPEVDRLGYLVVCRVFTVWDCSNDGTNDSEEVVKMSKQVGVYEILPCDFCGKPAKYDGKTKMGPWADMCETCFRKYGVGLGTGKGQKLIAVKK